MAWTPPHNLSHHIGLPFAYIYCTRALTVNFTFCIKKTYPSRCNLAIRYLQLYN
ncbi:hypothetical protein BDZ94DRAFT_1256144 [Collybia nuda]|uniref:Uncharacterized protein n=1 Tax=Collybia nuda TaxID=64659 RepID=A0A9P5Y9F9_9AGAR|nr:hypothetical protein BDZ94DRAFT_1256144 [Collybia nuda]